MNLYEILGVDPKAPITAIRAAYMRLAKVHHPDKGGSEQKFQQLQLAYNVLKDETKRAHYDETGETQPKASEEEEFQNKVLMFLNSVVQYVVFNDNLTPFDNLQAICIEMCEQKLKELDDEINAIRSAEKKIRRVVKRWKRKTPGKQDFIAGLLTQKLEEVRRKITLVRNTRKIVEATKEILVDYDFIAAKPKPQPEPNPQVKVIVTEITLADMERLMRGTG